MDNGKKATIIIRLLWATGVIHSDPDNARTVTMLTALLEAIDTVEAERGA